MAKKLMVAPDQQLARVIQAIPSDRGTYALVNRCDVPFQAVVGNLGPVFVNTGFWIYIGSAFGAGGLKSRLRHHLNPSPRPHWHLDYVKHALTPVEIWFTTDARKQEHAWATVLSGLKGADCPIAGFGSSDCACPSHLIHRRHRPGFTGFSKRIRNLFDSGLRRVLFHCEKR